MKVVGRQLLASRTAWIAALALAYVLVTGDSEGLQKFHLDDHLTAGIVALVQIANTVTQIYKNRQPCPTCGR